MSLSPPALEQAGPAQCSCCLSAACHPGVRSFRYFSTALFLVLPLLLH